MNAAARHFPGRPVAAPYIPPPPDIEPADPLASDLDAARGIYSVFGACLVFWLLVGIAVWWMRT